MQVDMMIHFARSRGIPVRRVREFLHWMGKNEEIKRADGESFRTLDVWSFMFDSRANELFAPENQSFILLNFLGQRKATEKRTIPRVDSKSLSVRSPKRGD